MRSSFLKKILILIHFLVNAQFGLNGSLLQVIIGWHLHCIIDKYYVLCVHTLYIHNQISNGYYLLWTYQVINITYLEWHELNQNIFSWEYCKLSLVFSCTARDTHSNVCNNNILSYGSLLQLETFELK